MSRRAQQSTKFCDNLNFGFLSSESAEICDEISSILPKGIAEGAISKAKWKKDRVKIADSEGIKPKVQVYSNEDL